MKPIPAIKRPLGPDAKEFLECLPVGIMLFTENNFPHVVEKFELAWGRPQRMKQLKEELIFEQRLGRQGFPLEVANEIFDVFEHYEKLTGPPSGDCIWNNFGY